jgi:hypothetical protein
MTLIYREPGIDQQRAGRPVVADGGSHGVSGVIIWFRELRTEPRAPRRRARRARIGQMKTWKILRDYRRRSPHPHQNDVCHCLPARNIAFVG